LQYDYEEVDAPMDLDAQDWDHEDTPALLESERKLVDKDDNADDDDDDLVVPSWKKKREVERPQSPSFDPPESPSFDPPG
jgi:hypothetical protein